MPAVPSTVRARPAAISGVLMTVGTLVIDEADADVAGEVEAAGVKCIVAPTVMRTPEMAAGLARTVLGTAGMDLGPSGGAPVAPGA
jgi:hypothetical protein